MSKIDWSLAPEGATHYNKNNDMFYSFKGGDFYFYAADDIELIFGGPPCGYDIDSFIERQKQPKAWSGPEDGLPPVGEIVHAYIKLPGYYEYQWRECEVVYHNDSMSKSESLVVDLQNTTSQWCDEFRAIKTPEQLAADQRESAIRELMDIAQVDCRVTAARLVDAGFKREVV